MYPSSVWEMSWLSANAIAVPLQRQIVFTTEALETFNDDELSAICVHEMGHLQESRGMQGAFRPVMAGPSGNEFAINGFGSFSARKLCSPGFLMNTLSSARPKPSFGIRTSHFGPSLVRAHPCNLWLDTLGGAAGCGSHSARPFLLRQPNLP